MNHLTIGILANQEDTVAIGKGGEVACLSNSLEDRHLLILGGKDTGRLHATQHGILIIDHSYMYHHILCLSEVRLDLRLNQFLCLFLREAA